MLESAIWWTGASVLAASAALGAAFLVMAMSFLAVMAGTKHIQRMGNVVIALHDMRAWIKAGKPTWKMAEGEGHRMEMRP